MRREGKEPSPGRGGEAVVMMAVVVAAAAMEVDQWWTDGCYIGSRSNRYTGDANWEGGREGGW